MCTMRGGILLLTLCAALAQNSTLLLSAGFANFNTAVAEATGTYVIFATSPMNSSASVLRVHVADAHSGVWRFDAVALALTETKVNALVSVADGSVVVLTQSTNTSSPSYSVVVVATQPGMQVTARTLMLPTDGPPTAGFVVGSWLYVATGASPASMISFQLPGLFRASALALAAGDNSVRSIAYSAAEQAAFLGCVSDSQFVRIVMVSVAGAALTRIHGFQWNATSFSDVQVALGGTNSTPVLFAALSATPVQLYALSVLPYGTMSLGSGVDLNSQSGWVASLQAVGQALYVTTDFSNAPSVVWAFNTAVNYQTFGAGSFLGSTTVPTVSSSSQVTAAAVEAGGGGGVLWAAVSGPGTPIAPQQVFLLNTATRSFNGTGYLPAEAPVTAAVVVNNRTGVAVYACGSSPSVLVQVAQANNTVARTRNLVMIPGDDSATAIAYDGVRGQLLVALCTSPAGALAVVSMSSLTRVARVNFSSTASPGQGCAIAVAADPSGAYAYVGFQASTALVQVALQTLTVAATLALPAAASAGASWISPQPHLGCIVFASAAVGFVGQLRVAGNAYVSGFAVGSAVTSLSVVGGASDALLVGTVVPSAVMVAGSSVTASSLVLTAAAFPGGACGTALICCAAASTAAHAFCSCSGATQQPVVAKLYVGLGGPQVMGTIAFSVAGVGGGVLFSWSATSMSTDAADATVFVGLSNSVPAAVVAVDVSALPWYVAPSVTPTGSVAPTASSSASASGSASLSPSPQSASVSPSATLSSSSTPSVTATPSDTATRSLSSSGSPSTSASRTSSASQSGTASASASTSASPTASLTVGASPSSTQTASPTPSAAPFSMQMQLASGSGTGAIAGAGLPPVQVTGAARGCPPVAGQMTVQCWVAPPLAIVPGGPVIAQCPSASSSYAPASPLWSVYAPLNTTSSGPAPLLPLAGNTTNISCYATVGGGGPAVPPPATSSLSLFVQAGGGGWWPALADVLVLHPPFLVSAATGASTNVSLLLDAAGRVQLSALPAYEAVLSAALAAAASLSATTTSTFTANVAPGCLVTLVAAAGARFSAATVVTAGGVPATVYGVSSGGALLHVIAPAVCPANSAGDCGYVPLVVANGDAALTCPPFCPGFYPGTVPFVPQGEALPVPSIPGTSSTLPVPVVQLPLSSALVGGLYYTLSCPSPPFTDPATGACTNTSDPRAALCAFGSGLACAPCPAEALCPGGGRAWPLVGYYTPADSSGLVVACAPPALSRCLGWSTALGATQCGAEYAQGSYACQTCAAGLYLTLSGDCAACPPADSLWQALFPLVMVVVSLLGSAAAVFGTVWAVARCFGGTTRGAAQRMVDMLVYLLVLLQLLGQVSQAIPAGLVPLLDPLQSVLGAVQLQGVALPSACLLSSPPFLVDQLGFSAALALHALSAAIVVLYYRRSGGNKAPTAAAPTASASKLITRNPLISAVFVTASDWVSLLFLVLTLVYPAVTNSVLSLLSCTTVQLPASSLAAADGGLQLLSARGVDPNSAALVSASVLASNPTFVCYYGWHLSAAGLAWVTLVGYVALYPLWTLLWVAGFRRLLAHARTRCRRSRPPQPRALRSTTLKQQLLVDLQRDPAKAHFTASIYRATRFYFRHVDFVAICALSLILVQWRSPTSEASAWGRAASTCLLLLCVAVLLYRWRPYPADEDWKMHLRAGTIALTALASVLQAVVFSSRVHGSGATAVAALAYTFGVGVAAVLLALVLAVGYATIHGARMDRLQGLVAAAKRVTLTAAKQLQQGLQSRPVSPRASPSGPPSQPGSSRRVIAQPPAAATTTARSLGSGSGDGSDDEEARGSSGHASPAPRRLQQIPPVAATDDRVVLLMASVGRSGRRVAAAEGERSLESPRLMMSNPIYHAPAPEGGVGRSAGAAAGAAAVSLKKLPSNSRITRGPRQATGHR